jgi:general secretion pathway protein D
MGGNGIVATGFVLSLSILAACVSPQQSSSGRYDTDRDNPRDGSERHVSRGNGDPTNPGASQRGTDSFLNPDALGGGGRTEAIVVPADGETVQLSLVNASIEAAAKAVLGDTLGLNYVVAGGLTGSITIQTTGPIPKSVLLELFEAALSANGAQIRNEDNVIQIVAGTSGNTSFQVAGSGGVGGASILVAPLKYIAGTQMATLLEPLQDEGLKVVVERERNLLLLSGPKPLLEAALDALNLFDVDVLQGKSVALVRLQSAEPEAVVKELTSIFEAEEGGLLEGVIEFIPNPRLGSILIVSSRANYIDRAQRWIRELDQTAAGSSVYLATYELQNRSASEVAPILNSLMASGGGDAQDAAIFDPEAAAPPSDGGGDSTAGGGALRVAADDARNTLIVRGTREDHDQISYILSSLDSSARQVLLEATIAEVTLNDEVEIGTRFFFERGNWDLSFSDLESGSIAGTNPGFTAVFGVGGADVALSALSSVTDVRVISAPTLVVLDNKEGILQIGDQVPIAIQNSTTTGGNEPSVVTQIDYRDTGIILRVRPRIGNGGRVLLDISQEISNVQATRTSGIDSPTISQRRVETSVALGDGQTLALGGLVQENDSIATTETPGLGRIPVLGNLFRNRNSNKGRTELLILIRPRVIEDEQAAAEATAYWRDRLSRTDSMLETGLGAPQHSISDFTR